MFFQQPAGLDTRISLAVSYSLTYETSQSAILYALPAEFIFDTQLDWEREVKSDCNVGSGGFQPRAHTTDCQLRELLATPPSTTRRRSNFPKLYTVFQLRHTLLSKSIPSKAPYQSHHSSRTTKRSPTRWPPQKSATSAYKTSTLTRPSRTQHPSTACGRAGPTSTLQSAESHKPRIATRRR